MSKAPRRAGARTEPSADRVQHWIAAFSSALLHLLLVLLAMWSAPMTMAPPQGADADAGGRMAVDFIGVTPPAPSTATTSEPATVPPAARRIQSTPVPRSDDPVPPEAPEDVVQRPAQAQGETPPASPTPPWRRSHAWGRPPGMLQEDLAPVNAGLARSAAIERGRGTSAGANDEPNLQTGGYQVYYSLRSENRLLAWRDQGITELFLPLPGTRQLLVCPLETALKRESGACRLLAPDSPELQNIGDAREAIDMQRVSRLGEVLWRGPGPYR